MKRIMTEAKAVFLRPSSYRTKRAVVPLPSRFLLPLRLHHIKRLLDIRDQGAVRILLHEIFELRDGSLLVALCCQINAGLDLRKLFFRNRLIALLALPVELDLGILFCAANAGHARRHWERLLRDDLLDLFLDAPEPVGKARALLFLCLLGRGRQRAQPENQYESEYLFIHRASFTQCGIRNAE